MSIYGSDNGCKKSVKLSKCFYLEVFGMLLRFTFIDLQKSAYIVVENIKLNTKYRVANDIKSLTWKEQRSGPNLEPCGTFYFVCI